MIEKLHEIESEQKRHEIDDVVEESDSFQQLKPVFEDLVGGLEDATVTYLEGDMGGEQKTYRVTRDDLEYRLECRLNLDRDDPAVSCEIRVREPDAVVE